MTLAFASLPDFDSTLRTIDARWKLAAFLIAAIAMAFMRHPAPSAIAFLWTMIFVFGSGVPAAWLARRLGAVLLVLTLFALWLPFFLQDSGPSMPIGPIRISAHGSAVALVLICKGVGIVALMLTLAAVTPITSLAHAAHRLRIPGLIVHLVLLTYRYLFVVTQDFFRLRTALRVRGYRNRFNRHSYRTVSHVSGTLLVRSFEQAERVGHAMRCRGFDGRFHSLTTFQTRPRDVIFFALMAIPALALLAWDVVRS